MGVLSSGLRPRGFVQWVTTYGVSPEGWVRLPTFVVGFSARTLVETGLPHKPHYVGMCGHSQ